MNYQFSQEELNQSPDLRNVAYLNFRQHCFFNERSRKCLEGDCLSFYQISKYPPYWADNCAVGERAEKNYCDWPPLTKNTRKLPD